MDIIVAGTTFIYVASNACFVEFSLILIFSKSINSLLVNCGNILYQHSLTSKYCVLLSCNSLVISHLLTGGLGCLATVQELNRIGQKFVGIRQMLILIVLQNRLWLLYNNSGTKSDHFVTMERKHCIFLGFVVTRSYLFKQQRFLG